MYRELYDQKLSDGQIARMTGVSGPSAVRRWRLKNNLPANMQKRWKHPKALDHDLIRKIIMENQDKTYREISKIAGCSIPTLQRASGGFKPKVYTPRMGRPSNAKVATVIKNDCINRGTYPGFKKYMRLNPHYFNMRFPGMTIKEAWDQVSKIKTDELYEQVESFVPSEYCAVGEL